MDFRESIRNLLRKRGNVMSKFVKVDIVKTIGVNGCMYLTGETDHVVPKHVVEEHPHCFKNVRSSNAKEATTSPKIDLGAKYSEEDKANEKRLHDIKEKKNA